MENEKPKENEKQKPVKIPFKVDEKMHDIYQLLNVAHDDFPELKKNWPLVIEKIKGLVLLKHECDKIAPILGQIINL